MGKSKCSSALLSLLRQTGAGGKNKFKEKATTPGNSIGKTYPAQERDGKSYENSSSMVKASKRAQ